MYSVPRVTTSAGHLADVTSTPLSSPQAAPSAMPSDEAPAAIGRPGWLGEQVAGEVGAEAEDRADRQVDVAGDDDERLADGEQREDRGVEREVAQRARPRQEARLEDRRDGDQQRRGRATMPSSRTRKHATRSGGGPARPRRRARRRGAAHAALSRQRPVAARITRLLVGLGAGELGGEPALVHDQHAVGHAEHLGQLGGDHQHGEPSAGQLATAGGAPRPWCRRRCRGWARR